MMKMKHRHARAMTLTEVICVFAIIAIIAAILFPVLLAARKSAHVTSCATSLKQIGTALAMYGADNNDWAPPWATHDSAVSVMKGHEGWHFKGDAKRWKQALTAYGTTEPQYWCDLDPHRGKEFHGFGEPPTSLRWKETSYLMNPSFGGAQFGSKDGVFRLNLTSLPPRWPLGPSQTVYLSDAIWPDETAPPGVNRLTGNHQGGRAINALYLDGSVRHRPVEEL